ncbi:BMP-binding endothelial regulator protein-like [Amphiura filiformis]|uniref:BMP-binding endothelial regulator protein-like n=1 Tax=Amphiura filiformis TaxID=82378 RepID=UPI003B22042C
MTSRYRHPGYITTVWSMLCGYPLFAVILHTWLLSTATAQLMGSTAMCDKEGEVIQLPFLAENPCISCVCKKKVVTCRRQTCPNLDGCALIITSLGIDCCEKCKSCKYNGEMHASGDRWVSPSHPCQVFQCQEGVVTATVLQCAPQCDNPVHIEGQCCPVCLGDGTTSMCTDSHGNKYSDGETFTSPEDPCINCSCENNKVICQKQACPVLSCPDVQTKIPEGECCPKCMAQRKVFDLGNRCLFQNEVYDDGETVLQDTCTTCMCLDSSVVCQKQTCPSISGCPDQDIIYPDDACCPRCKPQTCTYEDTIYQDGDTWNLGVCDSCTCTNGLIECRTQECPEIRRCPKDHDLQKLHGECCARCIERNAVCSVFGDPHYRTFDGRLFNFQGTCKYLLASDCEGRDFKIRVRNDGRGTDSFAWTKTLFITLAGYEVTLLQDYVVRVNRKDVKLPYLASPALEITMDQYLITVKTGIGLEITWDGDSFAEIFVSPRFKRKLCGLCGNYNGNRFDDYLTPSGTQAPDGRTFAESWKLGDSCLEKTERTFNFSCEKDQKAKKRATKECRVLKSQVFKPCRGVVDMWVYYRSCLTDACECPKKKLCACEAIEAYTRECRRQGVQIDYSPNKACGRPTCPDGAVFDVCVSACPRTCENMNQVKECRKPCQPGCQCPTGTVLHNDTCIEPSLCP